MNTKTKELGQFYTTNSNYILSGMEINADNNFIEPFVGNGDLITWLNNKGVDNVETYDIDPKIECNEIRDTLLNPPDYNDKFIITNPPYLARNKSTDKTIFDKWDTNDLYKAFILSFIKGNAKGGIMIIPLNFLCSRDSKIRKEFFRNFKIDMINIFEEKVFDDTGYTVCSIKFSKITEFPNKTEFKAKLFPSKKYIDINLSEKYGWLFGGEIFKDVDIDYKIGRLLKGQKQTTNLKLYAIDSGTMDGRIRLEYDENPFYGSLLDRTCATISTNKKINDEKKISKEFNKRLEEYRKKYHSLFLNTYRNSTKYYTRKRISFNLSYNLIKQIISETHNEHI